VETEVTIETGVTINGGNALRKLALKSGEVRDLGDVKANEMRQP
jgi:hypothetical protein